MRHLISLLHPWSDHQRPDRGLLYLLVAVGLVVAACGGDASVPDDGAPAAGSVTTASAPPGTTSEGTTETASPATAGSVSGGECTIEVTGDWEKTWTFSQSIYSLSTDYWMSEEELRQTVEFLGEDIAGGSYEELVERGEPVITFLSVGCSNADNLIEGVTATHTNETRSTDLPMAPGTYPITGGFFDADGPAASVVAEFSVETEEVYGTVPGSGSLEITRWDREAIEGSVSFDAREGFVDAPREIRVVVSFSYLCEGWFSGC